MIVPVIYYLLGNYSCSTKTQYLAFDLDWGHWLTHSLTSVYMMRLKPRENLLMWIHINIMCFSRNRIKNGKVSGHNYIDVWIFRLQRSNCAARPCPPATRKAVQMPVSLKSGSFCGKSGVWSDSKQEEQRSGRPDREGGKCKISTRYPPDDFLNFR